RFTEAAHTHRAAAGGTTARFPGTRENLVRNADRGHFFDHRTRRRVAYRYAVQCDTAAVAVISAAALSGRSSRPRGPVHRTRGGCRGGAAGRRGHRARSYAAGGEPRGPLRARAREARRRRARPGDAIVAVRSDARKTSGQTPWPTHPAG